MNDPFKEKKKLLGIPTLKEDQFEGEVEAPGPWR